MHKIGVIIGSSRPSRIGHLVTDWTLEHLPESDDVTYEIIDLQKWNLPMFDEIMQPSSGQYNNEHTKKWSAHIHGLQGFIFVTPEYNAGYPAVLKNAIDYLKAEWTAKPALVISYGWDGGKSSNNQLREVLTRIGSKLVDMHPALAYGNEMFTEDGKVKDINVSYKGFAEEVEAAGHELLDLLPITANV